ncbi:hypothetical protein JQ607_05415 [Bradyrhizobium liaoningense]|uniref:hypothetical protein n=1 Tax=Bradyrhizobium liaoningense TaxID=43992 RepID=UPI001BA84096|nr:hypothetical protein [Bradyrhizobium liaoningense]MBR0839627.1 hypothetical protein [Bradyrhizobium liaoningense]
MRKVRVGAVVDGKFRRLLSIAENSKNELTIGIQSAATYEFSPGGPQIIQQKYTVHASLDSPTYNTITHTLVLSDGQRLRSYAVTDAIKTKSGFALLFSRRCPDLSLDRYLLQNAKAFVPVVLGTYDTKSMTPVHAVFVGAADTEFDTSLASDFMVHQIVFNQTRLVIVHGAFPLPSHSTGDLSHIQTFKPEDAPPEIQDLLWNLMKGWSSQVCLDAAQAIFKGLFGRYAALLIRDANLDEPSVKFLRDMAAAAGIPIPETVGPEQSLVAIRSGQGHPPPANPE